jgi:hypothetical protein
LTQRKLEGINAGADLEINLAAVIENMVLSGSLISPQEFLLEIVSLPAKDSNFYLDKIFSAQKVNKQILILFFKFYASELDGFYFRVEQKLQDLDFLSALVETLGQLDTVKTLEILEHTYILVNELIKIEILNIMCNLKKINKEFLLHQLDTAFPTLRKKILFVLISHGQLNDVILDSLLKPSFFWGRSNERLIENMQIVFDLGLTQAAGRINSLSRKGFFWQRKLRTKAKRILQEWNVH